MRFAILTKHLALAAAVAALALPAAGWAGDSGAAGNMPTGKAFLTAAADINLSEISLGKLAEQKGATQAVKDFGKRMVDDHTKLESQLETCAKQEGVTLPTKPGGQDAAVKQQLSQQSGAQFDQAYIQQMISGHKQAVAMFQNEIEHGQDPAIKSAAQSALPVIQQHLQLAQNLGAKS